MPRRAAGFTLIEVMVVVFIIGITASLAVLTMSGGEPPVETETRRLKTLLGLVREESILQGRNLGLRFDAQGYQFFVLGNDKWTALAQDPMLRHRELPDSLRLELEAEGEQLKFFPSDDDDEDKKDEDKEKTPQVFFLASGEVSPFSVIIRPFDGDALRLSVSETGDIEVEPEK
jgi:general secretion pathway protein H